MIYRSVRLFLARRAASAAEVRATAMRSDIDDRVRRMEGMPPGDAKGIAAAFICLDLPAVWEAERAARMARRAVHELEAW